MQPTREEFVAGMRVRVGERYLWGGKGMVQWLAPKEVGGRPTIEPLPYPGWDCLGLGMGTLHLLGGPDHRWRYNCTLLAAELSKLGGSIYNPEQLREGDAVFFADRSGRLNHVEWWLGEDDLIIGARGGGSWTLTLEDAQRAGACVGVQSLARAGRPAVALRSMSHYLI